MDDLYITTSIPYVNGSPHLGHALELVHVDVLARHRRLRGAAVRVQSGTDDHALKNVSAATRADLSVRELVARNGDRFLDLVEALGVRTDEFVRTSTDPRHAPGVAALWEACRQAGDLYQKDYTGLYCPGCEQFYTADELDDGRCSEHRAPAQEVTETNWFFRLRCDRSSGVWCRPPSSRHGGEGVELQPDVDSSASDMATSYSTRLPRSPTI